MKKLTKKDVIEITAAAALGAVAGVVAIALFSRNAHILKEAKWTPDGDMMLTFFHRDYAMIIPKPE